MTVFEILNFNKELLKKMRAIGIRLEDAYYIELYKWNCLKLKRIGIYILYVRSLNLFVILNLILFMIKEKKRLCGNVTSKR